MSDSERSAFEERIAQNTVLAQKVAEVKAANEAIYYASLAEMKNTIRKDLKNIKYKPPIDWRKAGIISVASLALLSGITTYFVTKEDSKTEQTTIEIKENKVQENTHQESTVSTKEKTRQQLANTVKSNAEHTEVTNATNIEPKTKEFSIQEDIITVKPITENKNTSVETTIDKTVTEPSTKKIEQPVVKAPILLCDKTFKISTEASCKEKETGSITILSDGAYSYTYQLDIQSKTGSKGLFTRLSAGSYDLLVTYNKECAYKQKIVVAEKWCAMNEAYSFNPDYNEKWKPIYESGSSGSIIIYDKIGKDIYTLPFGSGSEEWNGIDRQGTPVSVGIYIAIITYSDGRKEKVELTVVR